MADRWLRSGRLAAWLALLAATAVLVTLARLVLTNLVVVLAGLVALAIVGAGAWITVTRRGVTRWLAAAAMVLALAGAVAMMIGRAAVGDLLAFAIALAVFAVTSRQALRAAASSQMAEKARAGEPGTSGRAVLLMNPKSGGGKVERFHLVEEATRRGIEPVVLRPGDDLGALAREAAARADVIGMAGGDGSQALVASVAMAHSIPFVCIPAGTRNHLALDLGLDREDVVGALDAFASGVERLVDLGFVNGRVFVNNVSLGVYAQIVQSSAYRDAKVETVERELPELLGPRAKPFDLRFVGSPLRFTGRTTHDELVGRTPAQFDAGDFAFFARKSTS